MDFEAINEKVGGCGLYHYVVFFLLTLPTFKQAVDLQGLTFALYTPKFNCDYSSIANLNQSHTNLNSSIFVSKDQCSYRLRNNSGWIPCTKWIYDNSTFGSSMITDLDFVCSRKRFKDLIYSMRFFGELVGFPIAMLSDKIGRRVILISTLYLSVPITVVQSLSYSLWMQILTTFCSGTLRAIYMGLAFTTMVELMPLEVIGIAATNFYIFFSFGYMATAGFAYFSRAWRMVNLLSLLPTVIYLLYLCFVPETPRWLMLKGKKERSFKTMSFISKINGRTLSRHDFDKWKPVEEEPGKIWNLFRYKRMICRFLILTFAAWSFSFAYIAASTDLTFASSNIFLTTLVMGMVEIPTGPLAAVMAKTLGRKKGITCLCSFGIVCLLIMPFMADHSSPSSWQPWVKVVLAMGGKLGFTSAWCVFDAITNELLPTAIRNGGVSILQTSVCLGGIIAPMLHEMTTELYFAAPCLIYSGILITTVLLVWFFLPETKNLPLPQTIEEAVDLVKGKEQEWKRNMMEDAKKRGIINTDEHLL